MKRWEEYIYIYMEKNNNKKQTNKQTNSPNQFINPWRVVSQLYYNVVVSKLCLKFLKVFIYYPVICDSSNCDIFYVCCILKKNSVLKPSEAPTFH